MEEKSNILVLGNSGVGKSCLINAVLGDNVAKTGVGTEGTTKKLDIYEPKNLNIRLIDSVGFEPSFFKRRKAIKQVDKWCKAKKDDDSQRMIDVIWFCVDGSASKLFDDTFDALFSATSIWKSIPIIVAITKSHSNKQHDEENIEMVKKAFKGKKREGNLKGIIPVNSLPYPVETEDSDKPSFVGIKGIQEILDKTLSVLPEGRQAAMNDIANFKLNQKRWQSHLTVGTFAAMASVVGAVPIPFTDAAILVPLETSEIKAIAKIYGIENDEKAQEMFKHIIEVGTVSAVAKGLISAIKAIPGINVAASGLNAAIAGSMVLAIGEGATYSFEQIYLGQKTVDDINWIVKSVEDRLKNGAILEKAKALIDKEQEEQQQ